MSKIRLGTVFLLAAMMALSACSGTTTNILPDRKVDYQKSRQAANDLEVPPDLSSAAIASGQYMPDAGTPVVTTYSEFATERSGGKTTAQAGVLPENPTARIERDGQERWLVVEAPVDAVWTSVVDFWRENGILLMEQDPVAGVMRTTWIENRAEIPSDFLTNFLRKTLDSVYSTGTRDQFRVRLERGAEPETTELYLTHYRMEEKLVSQTGATDIDQQLWVPKGSDPELEAIMLQRILTYLGISEQQAEALAGADGAEAAQKRRSDLIVGQGAPRLVVHDDFARSWRLVGIALDRVNFTVEDLDRSLGRYYVRYNDPSREQGTQNKSWLAKLNPWSKDAVDVESGTRFIVSLRAVGDEKTEAVVLTEQGVDAPAQTAQRILTLVHEQIR
jgi:outer membrane protein assembly factor BamC